MDKLLELIWQRLEKGWDVVQRHWTLALALVAIGLAGGAGASYFLLEDQINAAHEQRDLYKDCLTTGIATPQCQAIAKDAPKPAPDAQLKADNDKLKAEVGELKKALDAARATSQPHPPAAFLAQAGGKIIGTDSKVTGMSAARAEGSGSEIDVSRADVSAQPRADFHLLLLGAEIFDPGKTQQGRTGVAIDARLWNLGTPSAAANWQGRFLLSGKDPIDAQFSKIPKSLKLSGKQGKSTITERDSLDGKTSIVSVGAIPVDGKLLFLVPADRQVILAKDTVIEITVLDIYGNATTAHQRVGDWLGPSAATNLPAHSQPAQSPLPRPAKR